MSGSSRSRLWRGVLVLGAGLLLLSAFVATPTFLHSRAAAIPFGSDAFAQQWNSVEPKSPNFWGPAYQPALPEAYAEATNGQRLVQYFDKARMEQTTTGGAVTNGLLTVELITGQRQFGDTTFTTITSSTLPVVGDLNNTWPTYAALGGSVFPARTKQSGEPTGAVYKSDGTFSVDPSLAAKPGAAFGFYQSDPVGTYAHNVPTAFSAFLTGLPIAWQTAMGYPLTEAFWVNVRVNATPTWVMVQPFERRVLSYTPTNPAGFQVEMGNIGQHYYQWRYGVPASSAASTTTTTTTSGSATVSGTPGALAIASVELGAVTETTFALTFKTNLAATSEILYGIASHAYDLRQDVATAPALDHTLNLTGLQPGTKYYFALRATAAGNAVQRKEDYFATAGIAAISGTADTATKTPKPATATATTSPTATAKSPTATASPTASLSPTATASPTPVPRNVRITLTHVTIAARNAIKIAPQTLSVENATVDITLGYEGSSATAASTAHLTSWTRDNTNATVTSTDQTAPLTLTDKQANVVLTATATIPFADSSTPSLVVTYTRKIAPSEYAAGIVVASAPLSNAKAPDYSVIVTFSVSLG